MIGITAGFHCDETATHCFTSIDIKSAFTMNGNETISQVYAKDKKLYSLSTNGPVPIDDIITADGWNHTRYLLTANGSMPGPPIVIYQNQKITIIVKNHLLNEAVTLHWHGIDQLTWEAMDGVAFVTQCPILPGQTFNYTFKPTFGGSYWYHSHVGNQREWVFMVHLSFFEKGIQYHLNFSILFRYKNGIICMMQWHWSMQM